MHLEDGKRASGRAHQLWASGSPFRRKSQSRGRAGHGYPSIVLSIKGKVLSTGLGGLPRTSPRRRCPVQTTAEADDHCSYSGAVFFEAQRATGMMGDAGAPPNRQTQRCNVCVCASLRPWALPIPDWVSPFVSTRYRLGHMLSPQAQATPGAIQAEAEEERHAARFSSAPPLPGSTHRQAAFKPRGDPARSSGGKDTVRFHNRQCRRRARERDARAASKGRRNPGKGRRNPQTKRGDG
jgi:hypothetical protein